MLTTIAAVVNIIIPDDVNEYRAFFNLILYSLNGNLSFLYKFAITSTPMIDKIDIANENGVISISGILKSSPPFERKSDNSPNNSPNTVLYNKIIHLTRFYLSQFKIFCYFCVLEFNHNFIIFYYAKHRQLQVCRQKGNRSR